MPKITPCLWFDRQAEEAVRFYTSVFKNSKIGTIAGFGEAGHDVHGQPAGLVMTIAFELNGQPFVALNGGPEFRFNEAISFQVRCETQDEIDYYWARLGEGGDPRAQQCGWLKDRFGVSWQIIPTMLDEIFSGPSTDSSERAMTALLGMQKLDIAALRRACDGR
jgi:predicted 3-demethylubiquinone-9 3-methyltransferase (glyoxalase superfamily)